MNQKKHTPDSLADASFTLNLLTDDQIAALQASSAIVHYNKGDVIFRQNALTSHLYFVKSGLVKIYKENNGKVLTLQLASNKSFMGTLSVFGSSKFQYSASAIIPSVVYQLDFKTFKSVLSENGAYALMLMERMGQKGIYLIDRLMSQYQKQLPGRIADVLLYFSEEIYKANSFSLPLSRRELAELAGTTKESFIRTLTEFKNDKIIVLDGKFVEIVSMEILKVLSKIG